MKHFKISINYYWRISLTEIPIPIPIYEIRGIECISKHITNQRWGWQFGQKLWGGVDIANGNESRINFKKWLHFYFHDYNFQYDLLNEYKGGGLHRTSCLSLSSVQQFYHGKSLVPSCPLFSIPIISLKYPTSILNFKRPLIIFQKSAKKNRRTGYRGIGLGKRGRGGRVGEINPFSTQMGSIFDLLLLRFKGRHRQRFRVKRNSNRGRRRKVGRMFALKLKQYRKFVKNRISRFPFRYNIYTEKNGGLRIAWGMTKRKICPELQKRLDSSPYIISDNQRGNLPRAFRFKTERGWKCAVDIAKRKSPVSYSDKNLRFQRREELFLINNYYARLEQPNITMTVWLQKWLVMTDLRHSIPTVQSCNWNATSTAKLSKSSNLLPSQIGMRFKSPILTLVKGGAREGVLQLSDVGEMSHFCSRFLEFLFNKKSWLSLNTILWKKFSLDEAIRCRLWIKKLRNFSKVLGKGFFLADTVRIFYRALQIKDPHLLVNWLANTLKKISFWKYRSFFHFLRYFCRFFLWPTFGELNVKGIRFKLKGKISVSGNARTRTVQTSTGINNFSSYKNRALHVTRLIPSFTGVMGFQLWLMF